MSSDDGAEAPDFNATQSTEYIVDMLAQLADLAQECGHEGLAQVIDGAVKLFKKTL